MGKAADAYKAVETKAKSIGEQIKELKQLQENGSQSVEDLARKLEPLAQAMATLIENAQASIETIERNNKKEHERLYRETESTMADWTKKVQTLTGEPLIKHMFTFVGAFSTRMDAKIDQLNKTLENLPEIIGQEIEQSIKRALDEESEEKIFLDDMLDELDDMLNEAEH
ncbi:MAG: hypothetical protein GY718_14030 [Lentisphaerae bacterium]|nr:hypothetical protein [Lentisphaerota bacterium]